MGVAISKEEIEEYILMRPELRVEHEGRLFKCRIGERSHMEGVFTNKTKAELALKQHVGRMIQRSKVQQAKRKKTNAKKSKS